MSAPAINALSPTPVIIMHLVFSFKTFNLTALAISSNVLIFKAFNFFGRLIEMVVILFSVLISKFSNFIVYFFGNLTSKVVPLFFLDLNEIDPL